MSSTQQLVDKSVIQIQDTIRELERGNPSVVVKTDIDRASVVVKEANESTRMLPKLQEIYQKSEDPGNAVEKKLHLLVMDLQFCARPTTKDECSRHAEMCRRPVSNSTWLKGLEARYQNCLR